MMNLSTITSLETNSLKSTRKQWLEAYYAGDHQQLCNLETVDFLVQENGQINPQNQRYRQIENRVKSGQWQPEKMAEKELPVNKISDTVYQVTGVAYSNTLRLRFEENWLFEKEQWRIASLMMTTL